MRLIRILPVLAFLALTACAGPAPAPTPAPVAPPSPEPTEAEAQTPDPRPQPATPVEAEPPPPVHVYGGTVSMAGQFLSLVLELQEGGTPQAELGHHYARLWVPDLPLEARGGGTVGGGVLTLDLTYGEECPGSARINGEVDLDGEQLRGTLLATDCTGSATGEVVLSRRPPAPEGDRQRAMR